MKNAALRIKNVPLDKIRTSGGAVCGEAAGQAISSCSVTDSMTLEIGADQAVAVVHYSGYVGYASMAYLQQ